jgi:hypothetical protein
MLHYILDKDIDGLEAHLEFLGHRINVVGVVFAAKAFAKNAKPLQLAIVNLMTLPGPSLKFPYFL